MISKNYHHLLRQHAKDDESYHVLLDLFQQQSKQHSEISQLESDLGHEFHFLQIAPASIVITDAQLPDHPVIFVNEHFEIETGYSFADIKGQNLRLLQGEDRDQPAIKILHDAIANEEACNVILRNYRKDGSMFWNELYISPIRDANHNLRYFIGVQHDVTERQNLHNSAFDQVKAQLKHQESLYQQLVENSLDAISLHAPNGKYIYANQIQAKLTGYSVHELLNMSVEELPSLVHPDDRIRTHGEAHKSILEGKTIHKIQYRLKQKNGNYIWVENFAVPLLDQNNKVQQILSTTRDISAQKEAEEALRTSIERSNALIEAIPDLMFRFDRHGTYLDIHARSEDLFAPRADVINRTLRDILPPKIAEQSMIKIQQTLETGTMQSYEYQLTIPEQGLRDYEVRMVPSGNDEVIAIVRDVSDLKATKSAYEKSRERSHKLIQAIPDLIFLLSGEGIYLDYEADTSDLYYQSDQLIGKTVSETAPPEFAEQAMHYIQEALQTDEMQTFEYQLPLPDRGIVDYEARIVPIDENEVISYVRDITASKRSQQRELELVLEKERRKLLTDFIKNAAHEFRTPLASISTSAHIMVQSDDKDHQRQKALRIEQQVHRLTRLLDMLLLMTRLNNTEILPKTRINVNDLQEELCLEIQRQNRQRHQLKCQTQSGSSTIMGNYDLLIEAIMQVFDNAQRFTPDQGTITFNTYESDKQLVFEISDTGVGISPEALQDIFQTFWRQDDVHTTPGFGLGLPIVQQITTLHKGTVDITSELNVGTTVKILIPI